MTTQSPLEALQYRYGKEFEQIRLQDKLLLTSILLTSLHDLQKRDLGAIYSNFTFWGDSFHNPQMEGVFTVFDGDSVFNWFAALEALLPVIKADFHHLGRNIQRLAQSGLDEDTAETVGLLIINGGAEAYDLDEQSLIRSAIAQIEANGDPLNILSDVN